MIPLEIALKIPLERPLEIAKKHLATNFYLPYTLKTPNSPTHSSFLIVHCFHLKVIYLAFEHQLQYSSLILCLKMWSNLLQINWPNLN